MLDLEIMPERSLGCEQWEFVLGMHLSQSVAIIQSQIEVIKGVHVLYSDTDPLEKDIIINLSQDGIRLFFDPVVQRLKTIEIYNMKIVKLKYAESHFNCPEVLPTIEQIEHSFGATHPGVFDSEKLVFSLNFRGLSFYFPVESRTPLCNSRNLSSLHFPSGTTPLVNRTLIYHGSDIDTAKTPELPLVCYHGQLYLKKAEIIRGDSYTKGLRVFIIGGNDSGRLEPNQYQFEGQILLGQTAQDVVQTLGSPSRVFYKSEDKMRIHVPNSHRRVTERRSDYFFNYFTLGFDVLFDAHTHLVKKLVLHTNYPGHYNFNMYHRCEFQLQLGKVKITAYSNWDDLCRQLTPSDKPVVLNRSSSTNTTNPFGSTYCYGYEDIIFEVMPNNHIGSVSIYGDGRPYKSDKKSEHA